MAFRNDGNIAVEGQCLYQPSWECIVVVGVQPENIKLRNRENTIMMSGRCFTDEWFILTDLSICSSRVLQVSCAGTEGKNR